MAYIPPHSKWYLAEIVEEFVIEGEPANIVHTNLVLVRADSPEEAYDRAIQLGHERELQYTNPEGKAVKVTFCGLRDLNVIHGELAHGTELIYERQVGISPRDLNKWVTSKENLGVFGPEGTSKTTGVQSTTEPNAVQ